MGLHAAPRHGFHVVRLSCLVVAGVLALTSASPSFGAPLAHPLRFFEGRTESTGTTKILMKKPRHAHSSGRGTIAADGTLIFIQDVHDEGEAPHQRVWRIKQTGPRRYGGTMSDAVGPVAIEQVGDNFRFRFKMRGGLSAEEWIYPSNDGNSGSTKLTVRKFGMTVASSTGTIRKLPQEANNGPD